MTFTPEDEAVETGGREDRLLPWGRVRDIAGISRATAWRMQQTGDFPSPVPVSPGRVAWWESELTAWKGARNQAKPLALPMRPRLPGMPGRTGGPMGGRAKASPPILPGSLPGGASEPIVETALRAPGRKRGARAVSADQLGFDF
ncbi:MAG: AlpA family phage regulatory protein [Brevundimonas sp.]|jgi:predicted DNA-binding transcriptional regulator AlpA|uniref:helix-turn-helix transcriptional regulator n=1 Tax=Brevundimonas sp. TaxID=1871086 RepID=UPI0025BE6BEB|nr:AlpA family phage regulatory protein [Brevundimonas sp.]MCH4267316.1 AlpA family phage regulatory protein [Brevundimonas sp.]